MEVRGVDLICLELVYGRREADTLASYFIVGS